MVQKRALITGIGGQDGPYLADILKNNGYAVIGLAHTDADLADTEAVERAVFSAEPDEIYNLAGQSSVRLSFEDPKGTRDITGEGAVRMLKAAKKYQDASQKKVKFFQAGSAEMFGNAPTPQNAQTPFDPRSPYAEAKVYAFNAARKYRETYGMFVCNGIMFNHESPRRPETFVTRKITMAAARIRAGLQQKLTVGNIDVSRDWGYAPEYMEAAYRMMNPAIGVPADDYVVGTGVAHTIREFIAEAFAAAGIPEWQKYLEIDQKLYRPSEVNVTVCDPSKAMRVLGWRAKTSFSELVRILVDADLKKVGK